jgi:uncharacterized protein
MGDISMIKTISYATVVSGLALSSAHAASFDCSHAPLSNTEQIICDDVRISKKDDQLYKEYTALLAALPASEKAAFKQEQHQWITTRDQCMGGYEYMVGCLHEAYDQRLYEYGLRSKKLEMQDEVQAEAKTEMPQNKSENNDSPKVGSNNSAPHLEIGQWVYILMIVVESPGGYPPSMIVLSYAKTPKKCMDAKEEAESKNVAEKVYEKIGYPAKLACLEEQIGAITSEGLKELKEAKYIE